MTRFNVTFLLFIYSCLISSQTINEPVMWLSFDKLNIDEKTHLRTVEDQISKRTDTVTGTYVALKDGVRGKALLLDGYSAHVTSKNVPVISGSFTVEGWIAPGAYPTNFCPVAEHGGLSGKGFSLGISPEGKPGFKIATQSGWESVEGTGKIPLLQWTHICGVYDDKRITLYLNGNIVSQKEIKSAFVPAINGILYIGISGQKTMSEGTIWPKGTEPVHHFWDGLLDELKIWNRALTESEFKDIKRETANIKSPDLTKRLLPALRGLDNFGSYYSNLKFHESWDHFWRTGEYPDIVVSFGKSGGHLVFWRGTSYVPHWVTENGIWYNNEFNETWSEQGCHEAFSDKRCQYSNVRLLENTPARSVVHWRYALNDHGYRISNIDSLTGWGDWSEEIYTIYPDGVAVREQTLHSSNLSSRYEWHEGIIVMSQGQRPEDVLFPEAVIMSNISGNEHVYSWDSVNLDFKKEGITYVINKENKWLTELPGANIELINTRSTLKPFVIINPGDEPKWDYFWNLFRRDVSMFPWWNHWPTSFMPSDGRYAIDSDKPSHTSLSHAWGWKPYKKTEYAETRLMLVGLTNERASGLVPLAKSWSNAPELEVNGNGIVSKGYELSERAYLFDCLNTDECDGFTIEMNCSPENPSVNPAFVVNNWNREEISIKIDKKELTPGKDFSYGFVDTANGTNLIIWINRKFDNVTKISILID